MKFILSLIFEKRTLMQAIRVAIFVGIILNLINQGDNLLLLNFSDINLFKLVLTFFVPYFVSTYSSVLTKINLKPGQTALISGKFSCRVCNDCEKEIKAGQAIPECDNCGEDAKWKAKGLIK